MRVWECKIVVADDVEIPDDGDTLPRGAARHAVIDLTGVEPIAVFSGWGGELTSTELEVL